MKNGKLKSVISLALAFTMLLCCTATAFAADIDFGSVDNSGNSGYTVEAGNVITTSDANNSITGDGLSYGLHFTNNTGTTTLTVVGDTTVGKGIKSDGDLTITGDTSNGADKLTATGDNSPGIDVGSANTLTIDGGVTVNATGNSDNNPGVGNPGVRAGEVDVVNGTLTATGADASAAPSAVPGVGIQADVIKVNGEQVYPSGQTVTLTGTPGTGTPGDNSTTLVTARVYYTSDEIDAALKYFAKLLADYDAKCNERGADFLNAAFDSGLFYSLWNNPNRIDKQFLVDENMLLILSSLNGNFATALQSFRAIVDSNDHVRDNSIRDPLFDVIGILRILLTSEGYYPIPD